jgi:hypothetical protein
LLRYAVSEGDAGGVLTKNMNEINYSFINKADGAEDTGYGYALA